MCRKCQQRAFPSSSAARYQIRLVWSEPQDGMGNTGNARYAVSGREVV